MKWIETRLMLLGGFIERRGYVLKLWACKRLQQRYRVGEEPLL